MRRLGARLRGSGAAADAAQVAAGLILGYSCLLALDWFFKLVPVVMVIPRLVRGQNTSLALFMEKLARASSSPRCWRPATP